jgi:hypothetical protein
MIFSVAPDVASGLSPFREDAGHRREIADVAIDGAEQRSDGRLVRRD